MAHSLSAKKRIRQNLKRRARNRARKKAIKAEMRAFTQALSGGDKAQAAQALRSAIKKIDQIAAKGTIHKNTAARRKSLLQRRYNAIVGKG